MANPNSSTENTEARYRIGAVCRLTGLSQHVLRVWEKRYGVVQPQRAANQRRLYSESDIHKLGMLKNLVDQGQAIGSIADLSIEQLENRIQQSSSIGKGHSTGFKPRLALCGEILRFQSDRCAASETFELVGSFDNISELTAHTFDPQLEVAVIEWPNLLPESGPEALRLANRLKLRHLVLVYDYAPDTALSRLKSDRITALHSPLDIIALEAVISSKFGVAPNHTASREDHLGHAPARQFTDRELIHLASQSPAIACECPKHLAQLVSSLARFEAYSAECESRDIEDAALHGYLYNVTAQARKTMEIALARVVELEGLSTTPET